MYEMPLILTIWDLCIIAGASLISIILTADESKAKYWRVLGVLIVLAIFGFAVTLSVPQFEVVIW